VAAVFSTWVVLAVISIVQTSSKATGAAAVAVGALESLTSPLFWLIAISFFALFFAAGRLRNDTIRIFLFWIPVTLIGVFGVTLTALYLYLFLHIPKG
jgi:hypothetical protein